MRYLKNCAVVYARSGDRIPMPVRTEITDIYSEKTKVSPTGRRHQEGYMQVSDVFSKQKTPPLGVQYILTKS